MVAALAGFLQTNTNSLCNENYELVHQILQTLIEMCVGNATNQLVALDNHVIHSINQLLQTNVPIPQCEHELSATQFTSVSH